MTFFRNLALVVWLVGACATPLQAQDLPAVLETVVAQKFNNGPAASILVATQGEVAYATVKGQSDVELDVAADARTRFRFAYLGEVVEGWKVKTE